MYILICALLYCLLLIPVSAGKDLDASHVKLLSDHGKIKATDRLGGVLLIICRADFDGFGLGTSPGKIS